ncbi:membrane-associated protein, putative [Bodo saltans]|uniref:Membrane-associated protein, putative n=1 Tax=Bodo saltans TaxID=75058 RepID=A0A0S4JBN1_BODSA|nr:membrane-associated protein, putative [Bodo saltans]|eukprot:CUG87357.1 membrane-associated protein, putative [Bodo saltans]
MVTRGPPRADAATAPPASNLSKGVRQRPASANRSRTLGTYRSKTVPAFILQCLTGLSMLLCVAVTILATVSILLPRLYYVEGSRGVSLPASEIFIDPTNASVPLGDVVLMPDFNAYIGIAVVCYGGDWSCTNRDDHTFSPLPSTTIGYISSDLILPNISSAVLDLTSGGPLDASLKRGAEACGKNSGRAVNLKNLLVLAVCVAAVVSFLVLIPTTVLQMRLVETERVVNAVDSVDVEFVIDKSNMVVMERATGDREIFWIVLPTLLSLLCCAAMVTAMILIVVLDSELYCDGDGDVCKVITTQLEAFVVKWSNVSVSQYHFSCGRGASMYAIWVGLAMACCMFLSTMCLLLMFHCGKRRAFLEVVQERIKEMQHQHSVIAMSVAHGVPIVAEGAAPRSAAAQRPASPLSRPRSPSIASSNGSAMQDLQRTSPVRAPPPPPGRKMKPLRSAAAYSPRERSASQDEAGVLADELASIAQQRMDLVVKQEAIQRAEIASGEKVRFVGSFGLIKRKAWRVERAVSLHNWCLDWYYGPLLDLLVEETFRRQELIRKWLEKLLERSSRFPDDANGEPFACRLTDVDEALGWASPYRLDGDGVGSTHTNPQDSPYSPISRLRGLPYFEEQWRRIMDSPTRRYYDPNYGAPTSNAGRRRGGGDGSSVEVSSASDDDSPRHHHDLLMRTATPGNSSRVLATPPRDRYSALRESRELYPVLYSPRQIPNHEGQPSPLDFRAITKATDDLRKAYEDAVRKSSSRPAFDRGVNASRDAALDFQHAIARSQAGLAANPPVGAGVPPPASATPRIPQPSLTAPRHWEDKPDSSWGHAAVAQRLAELSKYTNSANADAEDDDDLR